VINDETAGNCLEKTRVQQKSGNDFLKRIVAALLLLPGIFLAVSGRFVVNNS
jgi:hypothetical protein